MVAIRATVHKRLTNRAASLTDASALIVLAGNPRSNYPYSLGLFAVGVPTGIGALVLSAKAERQIEQSIADYNRSLPDAR